MKNKTSKLVKNSKKKESLWEQAARITPQYPIGTRFTFKDEILRPAVSRKDSEWKDAPYEISAYPFRATPEKLRKRK